MSFVRVKSAAEGDPQHEFDVPAGEYEAHPELYTLVDGDPVSSSREPTFSTTTQSPTARTTSRPSARAAQRKRQSTKSADKKPGEQPTAPTGADSEEKA